MKTTVAYLPREDNPEKFDYECVNCSSTDIEETSTHCPDCKREIDWDKLRGENFVKRIERASSKS